MHITKLKKARLNAGLTQKKLSEITGISLRTLQGYEEGRRSLDNAQFRTTILICHALGCNPVEVIEDEELKSKIREMQDKEKM